MFSGLISRMDGALRMCRSQTGGDAAGDLQGTGNGEAIGSGLNRGAQAFTLQEFHGDEEAAVLSLVEVGHLDDVGMTQLVGGSGLRAKSLDEPWIFAQIAGEEFKRHADAEKDVVGKVDDTHAALTQFADDAVLTPHQAAESQLARADQDSRRLDR